VSLLSAGERGVRMAAAQVLTGYGKLAVPYLLRLEVAVAKETDEVTKKTMIGAIQGIKAANP